MAEKPPSEPMRAKAPAGPKVSGARTVVSLGLLVIVLIVCVIEVRAGLGQYLTLKSFAGKSENSMFQNVTLAEAQAMISMFPSNPIVVKGESEDSYHYHWYSLLRPLAGKDVPELYVSADHSDPPRAVSFYTSIEGEPVHPPFDPNAVRTSTTLPGMPMGAGGPGGPRGGGMGGPGGPGGGGAGGPGGPGDGGRKRPALEGDATEPAAKEDPSATEPAKSEDNATPAATEPGDSAKEDAAPKDEKADVPAEPK